MKIHEIHDEIERVIAENTDRETGEITDHADWKLQQLQMEMDKKILAIAAYAKGEECEGLAVAKRAHELEERAERHIKRAEWLRQWVRNWLEEGRSIQDDQVQIKWRTSTRCEVIDPLAVEHDYIRTVTKREFNKAKAKEDLKVGKNVPGFALIKRKNINIK